MSHLSEPDADRQLDEGSEPPYPCPRCDAPLTGDETCPVCEDADLMAAMDAAYPVPDEEDESAAFERWYFGQRR